MSNEIKSNKKIEADLGDNIVDFSERLAGKQVGVKGGIDKGIMEALRSSDGDSWSASDEAVAPENSFPEVLRTSEYRGRSWKIPKTVAKIALATAVVTGAGLGLKKLDSFIDTQNREAAERNEEFDIRRAEDAERNAERRRAEEVEKLTLLAEFDGRIEAGVEDGSLQPDSGVLIIDRGVNIRDISGDKIDTTDQILIVSNPVIIDGKAMLGENQFMSTAVVGQTDEKTGNLYAQFVYPEAGVNAADNESLRYDQKTHSFSLTNEAGESRAVNTVTPIEGTMRDAFVAAGV